MVRFGWPVKTTKYSPPETNTYTPPRYQEERHGHAATLPFPSTVTSTVPTNTTTSTTQTTHFLSLPVSRKLQEQRADPPQRLSMHDMRPYQAGLDHQRTQGISSRREKSLPPTPTSSNEDVRVNHIRRADSSISIENQSLSHRPSNQFPLPTTTSPPLAARPSPSQAKIALAQAALAIGLPHGMPQASASSSRSDVTSPAFLTIPQPSRTSAPSSGVRRAKSLHQLSRTLWRDDNDNTHASPERPRRSRRTSFGPANALDSEGKGDRNAVEDIPSHITPPRKSLVRKASFWNRKHNDSLKPAVPLPPADPPRHSFDHLSHILPSLPPVTPLRFDTDILCSSHSSQTEENLPPSPPGLNRRSESHSCPLPPNPAASSPDLSVQTLQTQPPIRRRPFTADPGAERSRTLSYVHPPNHSSPLVPTPPPNPEVATPRRTARPRSQTNPAFLLHRLSANIFSFSSSSLSPLTSGTNRVPTNHSPIASPRPSTSKLPPPKPRPDESPVAYVDRLLGTISRADVASVLASSGESFYTNALQAYIDHFDFHGDPLDVALRKLLMDVGLPRETQQIDRVMETFANRYLMCNRNLFISNDHPYILAFSLIMLHTDAFNKSNKRKMTKADYIKNTQLAGIYPEVLEYYYDNIVFAPFIFVEDPVEANLQRNPDSVPYRSPSRFPAQHSLTGNGSTVALLGKTDKIDPYYLIVKNLLNPLRVNVEQHISFENHYSYKDDSGVWNEENIHKIFINAGVIEVARSDRRMSTLGFALNFGGTGATHQNSRQFSDPTYSPHQCSVLRVVKVGLLYRRDTSLDIGKRVKAGKWRLWSVILTSSQLLFFRDQSWATGLQEQMRYRDKRILVPPVPLLKPDEVLSLKDAVALHDRTHDKHYSFLLLSGDRRPFLLRAPGEEDINSWISCINYASAFKTTGVSMRAPGMSGKDVELMGVAAAASHLRDIQCASSDSQTSRICAWSRNSDEFIDRLSSSPNAPYTVSRSQRSKIINGHEDMDLDVPSAQNNVGAHQLKATFHQVKADLAAGRWTPPGAPIARPDGRPRAHSLECAVQPSLASFPEDSVSVRTRVIQAKLGELDSKIHSLQRQEESNLRLLRNIAVLTPFQRATREKLGLIVLQTSRRIQATRLVLAIQLCHKEVLSNDLIVQEREWRRAKTIALKVATDTLQSRCEPSIPRILPPSSDQPMINPSDDLHRPPQGLQPPEELHPPESSIAESFHSALDFDWTVSAAEEGLDSPIVSVRNNTPTDMPRALSPVQTADGMATPEPGLSHETYNTPQEEPDEEAEQWDKTRAAKRVSLVRMPSTLNVSLGRLGSVSGTGSVWMTRSPRSDSPEPEA